MGLEEVIKTREDVIEISGLGTGAMLRGGEVRCLMTTEL